MKVKLTEELWKEGNMYVSYCPELDIAASGESVAQAKRNLREVIQINLEEARKMGTLGRLLEEAGLHEMQGMLASRKELVGFTPIEVATYHRAGDPVDPVAERWNKSQVNRAVVWKCS